MILIDAHCWKCKSLIGRVALDGTSVVELKCRHCKALNRVTAQQSPRDGTLDALPASR